MAVEEKSTGAIILLNGASSSGKSTLARALQAEMTMPFWHVSIDHFLASEMLPTAEIASGRFHWRDLRPDFFEGFHRCLPALSAAGNNLLVEHIVEEKEWMDRLLELLAGFDVFFVGVHCPLEELERRERVRGNRRLGDAKRDFETTHTFCKYDFEVDSTVAVEDNVWSLIAAWQRRASPSAFDEMRLQVP